MTETLKHEIDRTGWPSGPWDEEPDKIQWTDEKSKLPCLIVRNSLGALCGYVGVEPGHPLHGSGDSRGLEVHGGVNYAAFCYGSICHVPEEGQSPHAWWLGFDCAHLYDVVPGMEKLRREFNFPRATHEDVYRDVSYVRRQCAHLASQLAEMRP